MINLRKGPRPKSVLRKSSSSIKNNGAKKKTKTINFLNWNWDKPIYNYQGFYSLEPIWYFIKDFKWFILGVIAALLILAFLPGKIWIMSLFAIISYVTNAIDGVIRLPFKIETGITMVIVLAAIKAGLFVVLFVVGLGLVLPHIQTGYFFRPASLMLYLWLFVLLKLVSVLPFGFFINALLGILLFNIGFLGIAALNNIALPFSRSVWSILKNILILVIITKLGVMAVFI